METVTNGCRGADPRGCRAKVFLDPDDGRSRMTVPEPVILLVVGPPPVVGALIVVADDSEVSLCVHPQLDQPLMKGIDVLVLIDLEVADPFLFSGTAVRVPVECLDVRTDHSGDVNEAMSVQEVGACTESRGAPFREARRVDPFVPQEVSISVNIVDDQVLGWASPRPKIEVAKGVEINHVVFLRQKIGREFSSSKSYNPNRVSISFNRWRLWA